MKLTNEQIEQILNDAPEGADEFFICLGEVNYINNRENGHQFKIWDSDDCEWVFSELIDGWQYIRGRRSLDDLREILSLRKELELSNSILNAYREKPEKQSEYIKELEREAERGESGVNGVV